MDINAAFPSNYLKASDLQGKDVVVTIASVAVEDIGDDRKPIVYFEGKQKGLVLNKTNGMTIAQLYGPETDNWVGAPITLFPTQTDFQGRQVMAIRVRMNAPASQAAPAAAPPAQNNGQFEAPPADLDDEIPF